ncbi:MAG: tripartite tricarboxylate transporter substrate binding protein [Deltaproteobacteria bacterium]|nr:tripartite tricarboxylate transporter substrate binding protein [Deltaproteobacteria bacterium]
MKNMNFGKCHWFVALAVLLGVCGLFFAATATAAEPFPSKEIELIVNFGPGGSTDLMARVVGNKMSKILGVPVVVINKPGGGGAIASNYVASKADGYTIGTAGASNLGTLLATSAKVPYTLNEFSAVGRIYNMPVVLVTKKGRYNDFASLINAAKQKPGSITFASWGAKSTSHILGELINKVTGVKMKHLAFDGGAKTMVAALGGHVDVALCASSTALGNLKAGSLTALATASPNRLATLPDVPTLKELGYGDATFESYDGLMASSKVPKDRLKILNDAVGKSMDQETNDALVKAGLVPSYMNGPEYDVFLAKNLDLLRQVAVSAGIVD